jgi:hypothetical protein
MEEDISSQVAENGSAVSSVTDLSQGIVDSGPAVAESQEGLENGSEEALEESGGVSTTDAVDRYVYLRRY